MGHKTLFAVLVRVIGVWMIVSGASYLTMFVGQFLAFMLDENRFGPTVWWSVGYAASGLVKFVAGCFCLFGSGKIANFAYRNNHTYCRVCGWDLTAVGDALCPECNAPRAGQEELVE